MARGDIVGGIKIALSKGRSLQEVMQSFYNAGYKKEDIEEAARFLKSQNFQPQILTQNKSLPQTPQKTPQQTMQQPPQKKPIGWGIPPKPATQQTQPKPMQQTQPQSSQLQETKKPETPEITLKPSDFGPREGQPHAQPQIQKTQQNVSGYVEEKPKSKIDATTILLLVVLILLLGVLVGVFFFKDSIIEFLNKILE